MLGIGFAKTREEVKPTKLWWKTVVQEQPNDEKKADERICVESGTKTSCF